MHDKECPYETLELKSSRNAITCHAKACKKPTNKSGFCEEHEFVLEILDLAEKAGYPQLGGAEGEFLIITAGEVSWRGYVLRHPKRRHTYIKSQLLSLLAQRELALRK